MRCSVAIVLALTTSVGAEPQLAGNVLVWVDAPLFLDADAKGANVRLGTLDQGRDQDVGYVVPMHVISAQSELIEVEPTADIECAWWRLVRPDGLASLHLFVKRDDLAPALVKPFSASFKDGSSISLQPGVAVLDGKVAFHDGRAPVTIPEASRGLAYAPHAITAPKRGNKTFLLDEKTDVMLGAQSFVLGPWTASAAEARGKRMLFHIATRCMTAAVSAPKEHVHAGVALHRQAAADSTPTSVAAPTGYYLPQGTPLTSATGNHVVATLDADRDVKKPSGARACTDFVITRDEPLAEAPHTRDASQPSRTLHLCAPAAAVKHRD